MKGLTHFVSGVAVSTFIPQVVRMSVASRMDIQGASSSFIIVLAGLYGIMPDTLDFKFGQFFQDPEYEIDPDPENPDPQKMAQAFANAVDQAAETGKEVRIQYFPIQLGGNRWRQYCIFFEGNEVIVQINEIVSTSQIPVEGTAPKKNRTGRATFHHDLKPKSDDIDWLNSIVRFVRKKIKGKEKKKTTVKPSTIDILSSTMFGLEKEDDGKIYFNWLPWHRTWSHSYVLGLLISLPVGVITYIMGLELWWLYPVVAFIGFATHLTEDMTGHIGGSLLWPLLKPRTEGLELVKASDPRTNFSLIYTSFIIMIFNIDRFSTQLITGGPEAAMPWWVFLGIFWVLPLVIYFMVVKKVIQKIHHQPGAEEEHDEPDGIGDAVVD
ncbi:MAG: metal-dependent hydrolase [Elusimicrobiota bacterium]